MKLANYLGLAREGSYAESTLAAVKVGLPFSSLNFKQTAGKEVQVVDLTSRGKTKSRYGFSSITGDISYSFGAKSIKEILYGTLGEYYFDTAAVKHLIWSTEELDLKSYSARWGAQGLNMIAKGLVFNSLEINLGEDIASANANLVGAIDGKGATGDKTAVATATVDEVPFAYGDVTVKINDVAIEAKTASITINNGVTPETGKYLGSNTPKKLRAGEREVAVTFDKPFTALDLKTLEWGSATGPSNTGATRFKLSVELVNKVDNSKVTFVFPKCYVDDTDNAVDSKEEIMQSANIVCEVAAVTVMTQSISTDVYVIVEDGTTSIA